jgi:hypothetical protein
MRPSTQELQPTAVNASLHPAHVDYLRRLDSTLVGPRRARRSLIAEASDHLQDAKDALVSAGHDADSAAQRSLSDFGKVADVAPAYQETLAVASSRRTALLLLLVVGYQPFLWDSGLHLGRTMGPDSSPGLLSAALDQAIEVGGALALIGAVIALLATGMGQRWMRTRRPMARYVGTFTLGSAALIPTLCFAQAAVSGAAPLFFVLAALLMVLPLGAVAASARSTLAAA